MKTYNAEITLSTSKLGIKGTIDKSLELSEQLENRFILFK